MNKLMSCKIVLYHYILNIICMHHMHACIYIYIHMYRIIDKSSYIVATRHASSPVFMISDMCRVHNYAHCLSIIYMYMYNMYSNVIITYLYVII